MAQYENKGDHLNILLADELPEDMTGTQDTQHICGKCAWYSFRKLESICRKTGKEVAYFANRECFTTDKDMYMEENNNAQPVAETGTQVCKECGRTLPLEDFQRRRYGKRDKVCKACRAEKIRIGIARKKAVKVELQEKIAKAASAPSPAGEAVLEEAMKDEKTLRGIIERGSLHIPMSEYALRDDQIAWLKSKKELLTRNLKKKCEDPADFSDADLLDELRRRGYKGRISKCEEVEI